jgi:hypothetical protein
MKTAVPHLVADHGHLLPAVIFLLSEDAAHHAARRQAPEKTEGSKSRSTNLRGIATAG